MRSQRSFLNSVKWAYTGNWGEKGFSALLSFILAAFLGPRDFGIAAIAVIYVTFLQLFLDQGLAAAVIQRKEIDQEHLDAMFWMDFTLGLALVALSISCSRKWAAANHSPEIARIIPVLSISIVIESLSVVQTSLLRRNMDFKSLSIRINSAVLIGGAVGIVMAVAGCRVWSLVGQQIVRDSTALILLWKMSPWRPRWEFSWKHLRALMGFSIPNFTAQLALFAGQQAGSVVLGLFFGPIAVGLYRVAERVVNSVTIMAMSSIQAVSLPEFSRLQSKPKELCDSVITCVRLSSAATLPAFAGLAAISAPLMATIGAKWTPASDVLRILSVLGMLLVFTAFTGPLLQALSRPHQLAILEWTRTAVGLLLVVGAGFLVRNMPLNWQINGIAMATFVTGGLLVTPVYVYTLVRLSGASLRRLASASAPAVVASVAVIASVVPFQSSGWLTGHKPIVILTAEAAVGGGIGLTVLFCLERQLREFVGRAFQKQLNRILASNECA